MNYLTASLKSSKIPNHSHPVPFIFVSYCLIVCFKQSEVSHDLYIWTVTARERRGKREETKLSQLARALLKV